MKKIALIICAGLMALVSCNKEIASPDQGVKEATPVVFNLTATHPGDTKAVKTGWETGDVVFVFFSTQAAPRYLEMKWNGTKWVSEGKNSLALTEDEHGYMTAVYLPFGSDATVTADGTDFKFSDTFETYYLTDRMFYYVTDGELSGTFTMKIPEGYVQFFEYVPSSYFDTEIELREPHLTPQGIASISADGTINHTAAVHGAPLPGYVYKKEGTDSGDWGFLFSGILAEEARNTATDYTFTMVYGGWDGSYFTQSFTGKTFYRGEQEGRALRLPDGGWEEITDYKPIDMGCEITLSGGDYKRVYWASRNLGASKDFPDADTDAARQATWGDYYAWGETEPYYTDGAYSASPVWATGKTGYDWDSYGFGPYTDLQKYNETDGLTTLEAADDAASVIVPPTGRWRMPTEAEWRALCNTTLYSKTWSSTQKGYTVTRKEGTGCCVGNSIFLPAAGERSYTELSQAGSSGYYWSASAYTSNLIRANHLYFTSSGFSTNNELRFNGMSIRPVHD